MARGLDNSIKTAIEEESLRVFIAVDVLLDSPNELYFWSGVGDLTYEGITYTGAGELLQISDIQESSDLAAKGATLTLSGIPSSWTHCIVKFSVV